MVKHSILALKGNKTCHDVAELTLMTVEHYRENLPPINLIKPNYEGDAANVHLFLTEHLPEETLKELKLLLFAKYLHAAIKKNKC